MSVYHAHGIHLAALRDDAAFLPDGFRAALAGAPSVPLVDIQRARALALTGSLREARGVYDELCGLLPLPAEHPARAAALTLAQALSNRQIAARLVLSERTVESHVRGILAKSQCANRTEFVARWNPA